MAKNMPSQFLCNVSGLPERDAAWKHPGLQGENLKDFLLPPRTHLFLYGPSHVRSVRHVLVSAARLQHRSVKSDYLSVSDDCDDLPNGLTGSAMTESPASTSTCGIFQDNDQCLEGDLVRDWFPETGSSITTISNHRQYLVPEHTANLNRLLTEADPPFTHGYLAFPHLPAYFDAHCDFRNGGPPPDATKIGDGTEAFCDVRKPTCMGDSPLYAAVRKAIPNVAFLGGVALKHNFDVNTTCSRIHDSYKDRIVEEGPVHLDPEARPVHVHACNVICEHKGRRRCEVGEGVAIAWEVLRSANLLHCPANWPCDPLTFEPLWVLGASTNVGALTEDARASSNCPMGERNAAKDECTAATVEAVGEGMVSGPLRVFNKSNTSMVPVGCSYSVADKRPVFNHAEGPATPVPGYPWICTYTVRRPLATAGGAGTAGRGPTSSGQREAGAAEVAADVTQWRRGGP